MQTRDARQKVVMLTASANMLTGVTHRLGLVLDRPVVPAAIRLACLLRFYPSVALPP